MMSERETTSTVASDFAQFVDQLHSLNLSSGELSHLEKGSAVLQAALQAEKSRLEIQKLEVEKNNLLRGARSEQVRFWVPIVAPFISAIAVVATLLFQMHQFNENSRLTRQTDEGVQFRAAIQSAKMPSDIQAYTSQALLTSFLKSEAYMDHKRGR